MVSKETVKTYSDRSVNLVSSFIDGFVRAEEKMVVNGSPVDYDNYKFIRSITLCIYKSFLTWGAFNIQKMSLSDYVPQEEINDALESFNKLEEELASQNEFLDKFVSKQSAHVVS